MSYKKYFKKHIESVEEYLKKVLPPEDQDASFLHKDFDAGFIFIIPTPVPIIDPHCGFEIREKLFTGHSDTLYDAQLSPNGKLLATASYDRKILLWDVDLGEVLRTLTGHNGAVYDLDFSPGDARLFVAGYDGSLRVWDMDRGQEIVSFLLHDS